jgi:hypothetical protein
MRIFGIVSLLVCEEQFLRVIKDSTLLVVHLDSKPTPDVYHILHEK